MAGADHRIETINLPSGGPFSYGSALQSGEVAEWSKAQHWKCCVLLKGTVGSNPTLSAIRRVRFTHLLMAGHPPLKANAANALSKGDCHAMYPHFNHDLLKTTALATLSASTLPVLA